MFSKYKLTEQEKKINYKIECPSSKDYILNLTFHSKTELFKLLFRKGKKALQRKRGIIIKEDNPEVIQNFLVPSEYYKFLKINIRGIFNNVAKEFKPDGIVLLNYNISKVFFQFNKDTKLWDIHFTIKGIYTKEGA